MVALTVEKQYERHNCKNFVYYFLSNIVKGVHAFESVSSIEYYRARVPTNRKASRTNFNDIFNSFQRTSLQAFDAPCISRRLATFHSYKTFLSG